MRSLISVWIDNWRLLRLYFYSEERIYARSLFLILIIMELLSVGLEVALTYWQNAFMGAFPTYNQAAFIRLIIYFCFFLLGMTVVSVYKEYWSKLLQIRWRRWLTNDFLEKYLSGHVYHKIALLKNYDSTISDQNDNPDQRISMDINSYIENTCKLVANGLHASAALISNIIVLWTLSGVIQINVTEHWSIRIYGIMVWAALTYAGLGTLITNWIGRALFSLQYVQEQYEANFRYGLVHLRDHTESVALYKSESNEHTSLSSLYFELMTNFYKFVRRRVALGWFTSFYNLAAHVFPFLVASPRYFSKAINFGDLIQTSMTFANVHKSLSFIPDSYETIVLWRASTKRLTYFLNTLDDLHATAQNTNINLIYMPGKQSIQIQELTIQLPRKAEEDQIHILLNRLDLTLQSYQSVLITGKSGCGKSTFLRTLAGIWPYGRGTIILPFGDTLAFLPQRPYCPLGSLRYCLTYPSTILSIKDDENIKRLLSLCQMNHWCDRLDEVQDWSSVLSLGEQQKMAFIRILHMRPNWIFLDEATSSMDEESETYFYLILFLELANHATIISVGHRNNLRQFHQVELVFDNGNVNVISLSKDKQQTITFF